MVKKKKKETFQEFRSTEKSAYTTIKTTLKSVLHNHTEVQPVITNLVFAMNDLMIHSYQFIRLYVLKCYNDKQPLPEINWYNPLKVRGKKLTKYMYQCRTLIKLKQTRKSTTIFILQL